MKIGIISDIHGNSQGLKKVLSEMKQCDKVLCAGDITGYYPFINESIGLLKKNKVISVLGNHDQYLLYGQAPKNANRKVKKSVRLMKKIASNESLNYLKSLPIDLNLLIGKKKILMCHGSPWNFLEERIYPDFQHFEKFRKVPFDIIILGHTHYPMVRKVGRKIVLNPGSCGQPRDYNFLSYAIWDTDNNTFENKRLKWNIKGFIEEAKSKGANEKLFEVFNRELVAT